MEQMFHSEMVYSPTTQTIQKRYCKKCVLWSFMTFVTTCSLFAIFISFQDRGQAIPTVKRMKRDSQSCQDIITQDMLYSTRQNLTAYETFDPDCKMLSTLAGMFSSSNNQGLKNRRVESLIPVTTKLSVENEKLDPSDNPNSLVISWTGFKNVNIRKKAFFTRFIETLSENPAISTSELDIGQALYIISTYKGGYPQKFMKILGQAIKLCFYDPEVDIYRVKLHICASVLHDHLNSREWSYVMKLANLERDMIPKSLWPSFFNGWLSTFPRWWSEKQEDVVAAKCEELVYLELPHVDRHTNLTQNYHKQNIFGIRYLKLSKFCEEKGFGFHIDGRFVFMYNRGVINTTCGILNREFYHDAETNAWFRATEIKTVSEAEADPEAFARGPDHLTQYICRHLVMFYTHFGEFDFCTTQYPFTALTCRLRGFIAHAIENVDVFDRPTKIIATPGNLKVYHKCVEAGILKRRHEPPPAVRGKIFITPHMIKKNIPSCSANFSSFSG